MSDELTEVPSMWYIITVGGCHCPYTAEGEGESPKRTWGKVPALTPSLSEVTFKFSTGTKGVSVALDEPDVTGGEKGKDGRGVGRRGGVG